MDKNVIPPCLLCRTEVHGVNMAESTPTRSTRFPEGLDERFTEYRDERDMTNSEALRSLVRAGLEERTETADNNDEAGGRPSGLIGSLLYDTRRSRGRNLGISMILLVLYFGLALPTAVNYVVLAVVSAYALSAVFGYVELYRAWHDPDPAEAPDASTPAEVER